MSVNFNNYKTQSDGYFPKNGGIASWDLTASWNVWDTIIDFIAILWTFFLRAESTGSITVGASPFVYAAGTNSEVIYISAGVVSAIEKQDFTGAWVSIIASVGATVFLAAGQQIRITYDEAPTMTKDIVGMFVNATGSIAALTPSVSPWTITNSTMRTVTYYIWSNGVVDTLTRNGVNIAGALPTTVPLPPGGSMVLTYTVAPTVIQDS